MFFVEMFGVNGDFWPGGMIGEEVTVLYFRVLRIPFDEYC